MARRGRKRKIQDRNEKENEPPRPATPPIDRSAIELEENEWMPTAAVEFFENFKGIDEKLRAIDSSVELVGPFRVLRGETDVVGIERIMLDRAETDLPEMQVFMTCNYGRFAFWRDYPTMKEPVVVIMNPMSFSDVKMIGRRVEDAILHLCHRLSKLGDTPLGGKNKVSINVLGMDKKTVAKTKAVTDKFVKERKHECIGEEGLICMDGPNGEIGYRKVCDEPQKVRLYLRSMQKITLQEEAPVIREMEKLKGQLMVCFDESDFLDGIEWGHQFFHCNKKQTDENAEIVLGMAYKLLKRNDFFHILRLTLEMRRRKVVERTPARRARSYL